MRESLGRGLDSMFGKGGCMEKMTLLLLKLLLVVGIGYLGIRMLIENINESVNNSVNNIPKLATTPLPPTAAAVYPTSTPFLLKIPQEKTPQETCVTIDGYLVPNAFRAWLKLGKPNKVIFKGQTIKDNEGDGIVDNLPTLVHEGDQLCTQSTSP
jgi:hypothetical protein